MDYIRCMRYGVDGRDMTARASYLLAAQGVETNDDCDSEGCYMISTFDVRVALECIDGIIADMDALRERQIALIIRIAEIAAEDDYHFCLLSEEVEYITGVNIANPE